MRVALKVLVSMMSAPAARYASWMSRTTSGRVSTSRSLSPASSTGLSTNAPRKSCSCSRHCWIIVPMAPSSTRMRRRSSAASSSVRSGCIDRRSCIRRGEVANSIIGAVRARPRVVRASSTPPRRDVHANPRQRAHAMKHLKPQEAFQFLEQHPQAVLVDCRSEMEYLFVGHPKGAHHVAWNDGPDWDINPHFVGQVKKVASMNRPVVLICRSGQRSIAAGVELEKAGFTEVYNVKD